MCVRILLAVLMSMPVAVSANALTPANPYAGQQTRSIKALSPEDIDELRKCAGMGLAKAAELNGYPGPLHVLALTKELRLTPDQVRQVTGIRERTSPCARAAISFRSCGRSAVVPVIFSRNTFSHPAALSWASWLVRSCASVETRA
jgi:hypothetical protein